MSNGLTKLANAVFGAEAMTTTADNRLEADTPRTDIHKIVVALGNLVRLPEDEQGRINRYAVMTEVIHIREDAYALSRKLTAANTKLATLRELAKAVVTGTHWIPNVPQEVKALREELNGTDN